MPPSLLLLLLAPLCFATDNTPFSSSLAARFSLHTAYRNVYRQRLTLPQECRPLAVSGVLRSGTSIPDKATIQSITQLLLRLRFGSAPATQRLLYSWKSSFFPEDSGRLTLEGKREADHIGARLQRLLKDLQLNRSNTEFATGAGTAAVLLKDSAAAFARNFPAARRADALSLETLPEENLPLYAPCGGAPTAVAAVGGVGQDEVWKFRHGEELRYRLKEFNKRHRLDPKFTLDDFLTAFRICADDTAADDEARTSPWCKLFTRGDVYAIEYLQDLEQFWRRSYGQITNVLPACSIAKKMMKMLEGAEKSRIKAQFLFTEAGNFLSLLSLLRIVKTEGALRADDFQFANARHFRVSQLVPFSANLLLILLRCKNRPEPLLLPFLNENRRSWFNCSAPCSLSTVQKFLAPCAPRGDALCLSSRNEGTTLRPSTVGVVVLLGFSAAAVMATLK